MLLTLGSAALGWGLVEMLDDDVAEGTSAAPRGAGGDDTPTASNADEPTDEPPADAELGTVASTFDLLTQAMAVEPSLLIAESSVADTVTGTAGDDVLIGSTGRRTFCLVAQVMISCMSIGKTRPKVARGPTGSLCLGCRVMAL